VRTKERKKKSGYERAKDKKHKYLGTAVTQGGPRAAGLNGGGEKILMEEGRLWAGEGDIPGSKGSRWNDHNTLVNRRIIVEGKCGLTT